MAALFNFYRGNTLNHETHEIHEKMFFAPLRLRVRNFDKRHHRIPVIEKFQRSKRSLLPHCPKSDIINSVCYMS